MLSANGAFSDLLTEMDLNVEDFLRGPLTENVPSEESVGAFFHTMKPGDCVVKQVTVLKDQHYTLHLIKLEVPGGNCLCCMLVPSENPGNARLVNILNEIACFVAQIDSIGNIYYVNDQLLHHLGYTPMNGEAIVHLRDLLQTFDEEKLRRYIDRVDTEGFTRLRTHFARKGGEPVMMEVSIVPSQTPGGSTYLLTARDIGYQLEHEAFMRDALIQSEKTATELLDKNRHLQDQADLLPKTGHLVYESKAFAAVMRRVHLVAPTDATVLITGETGTGKELIAKAIHQLSERADQPFVTVDCGSLPPELIESELFGYRKGAFTGANTDRKGRFATADRGTIFLDEIGELPLLLQTRLLRVLQEGHFTPVGETQVQTVDVRVIAATNRDLKLWIEEGKFRSDLFFRLNVFPIHSIPLRERKEDIRPLIRHFIDKFNKKFSKEISGVDATTLDRIMEYDFPGNVRELETIVERAFIVASGKLLPLTVPQQKGAAVTDSPLLDLFDGTLTEFLSFDDYQRKYIELVLKSTGGRVSGKGGAAEILQLNPQTLYSKMRKLGLRR